MRLQNRAFKLAFRGADDGPGPWVTLWCGVFKDLFSLAHGPVITDKGCAGYLLLKMFLKPSYKNSYLYKLNHVAFSSGVLMKNYHRQIFIKI